MRNRREFLLKLRRSGAGLTASVAVHLGILLLAFSLLSAHTTGGGVPHEITIELDSISLNASPSPAEPSTALPRRPEESPSKDAVVPNASAIPDESRETKFVPAATGAISSDAGPQQSSDSPSLPANTTGADDSNALISMLLNQMRRCWVPPVGKPHSLTLSFRLSFNEDGTVANPPDLLAVVDDPYFRAAADATRRALYACAPYSLPQSRYGEWAEIANFSFDPSAMTAN